MLRSTFGDVVVTSHAQATQAGMEILAGGGNAIDAAVGANAVLGVIAPEMCGVGGDLFALVHRPGLSTAARSERFRAGRSRGRPSGARRESPRYRPTIPSR